MQTAGLPAPVETDLGILKALGHRIASVESSLQLLDKFTSLESAECSLSDLETAKLNVALAYSMANLYFMRLNIDGKDVTGHPIHEVLKRIKEYMTVIISRESSTDKAVNSAASGQSDSAGAEGESAAAAKRKTKGDEAKKAKKKLKIDSTAAERVVRHHIQ